MTTTPATELWNGSDKESFSSLDHPGYSLDSDPNTFTGGWLNPDTFTGGWLAYCKVNKEDDWIEQEICGKISQFNYTDLPRSPRILLLYGSLRESSFSCNLAYENARLLELLGCDVCVYNPHGLPVRDPVLEDHTKVVELRALTHWSDGHCWVSPEMHGTVTDWIPLNTVSVRLTRRRLQWSSCERDNFRYCS